MTEPTGTSSSSRRGFLKASTAAAVGGAAVSHLGFLPAAHAAGSDTIRVGVVGCGGRGRGAADNCVSSSENVKIVALGDAFRDQIDGAKSELQKLGDKVDVPAERCFVGLDAYKQVLDSGIDLVILATPPGFRPLHLQAAVAAGKHIFTEKPVAVDGPGIRAVLAAAEEAKKKNLAVVAGTQRRHQAAYLESMKRIHDGQIGDITTARCYWNQGALWKKDRESSWSDVEWQLRNWLYFTWLSGDHICEQHVHNLDVVNWALKGHPEKAIGLGGRQVRTDPAYGHIYDHFAIDYEYPGGIHVASYCRQIPNTQGNVSEAVVGSKGTWSGSGGARDHRIRSGGKTVWQYRANGDGAPYVQEHTDLIASIRKGEPLNELRQVAESTLTAIMGRMAAYTGQEVSWNEALESKQKTMPERLTMDMALPVPAVAMPGTTDLI